MSLKPETITQLETMIQADPALITQLKTCTDAASSAVVIAKAAAVKGVAVSEPDLLAHFEAALAQQGAMSDAELEQVAGGGKTGAILISVFTAGLGCLYASIDSAIKKTNCGTNLNDMTPL